LSTFTIPSSVTSIGDLAFAVCGFTNITIPSSVNSIGYRAFISCHSLTTITIPSSVTSIGDEAFYFCNGLSTVIIPSSVTSIGKGTFYYCTSLTSVTIPSSVTSIGDAAFAGCSSLYTLTLPFSVATIGGEAFYQCTGLTSVSIPSSVTSIGFLAFWGCSGMTTVSIPSSVTSIGVGAFEDCRGLTSLTTNRITPLDLSPLSDIFLNVDQTNCILYVPVGSGTAYQAAPVWKDFKIITEKNLSQLDPIISDQKLNIYPNPTSGNVKLVFDQTIPVATYLEVNDITGKLILKRIIQDKEEWIDLKGNVPGVYLIKTNLKNLNIQKVILK